MVVSVATIEEGKGEVKELAGL